KIYKKNNKYYIENRYDFLNTDSLDFEVRVYEEEKIIYENHFNISIKPHETKAINLKYERSINENILMIIIKKDNKEIAFYQEILKGEYIKLNSINNLKLEDINIDFNIWRASTDNDRLGVSVYKKWKEKRVDLMECIRSSDKISENKRIIKQKYAATSLDWGYDLEYKLSYTENKDILVQVFGKVFGNKPNTVPRLGIKMKIDKKYSKVRWYGLGEEETYIDSCSGKKLGVYELEIDKMMTPYIYPQESGNRSKVRWFELKSSNSILRFDSVDRLINFSVSPYDVMNIEKAKHREELIETEDLNLNIDYEQYGLGTASCGEETLEKYRLECKNFKFQFIMKEIKNT
ncbi:beta-galactosidase small subunit-related protein, partial [Oceanivirga salmonicida]|uniref:beta-galactosidase domain 4-containing protein n=1 Tax=Oceanivirga salmonicida TaxID=1769291 RepID=UPI0018CC164B